jgi:hypothetical protein
MEDSGQLGNTKASANAESALPDSAAKKKKHSINNITLNSIINLINPWQVFSVNPRRI